MYPIREDLPFYANLRILKSIGFYSGITRKKSVRTLIFCILCWSIILLSAVLLIYENLNDKNYASVFFNIAVAVASTSAYCCTLLFVKYQEKWSDILTALANYEKFGEPARYNQLKKRGDRVALACWGGILTGVFLYMLLAILHENDCDLVISFLTYIIYTVFSPHLISVHSGSISCFLLLIISIGWAPVLFLEGHFFNLRYQAFVPHFVKGLCYVKKDFSPFKTISDRLARRFWPEPKLVIWNKEQTGSGVCGLIIPTWLPAPYDHSLLARRLVLLYDIPNAAAVSSFVLVTHLSIQVNEFNIARIDHLSLLFSQVEFCKKPQDQLNKMKHCIEYHQDIIRVSYQFKKLSKRTMGHMTLTFTIVTASMGCHLLQTSRNFYQENAFFFEIIYVINMFIMCYCGQRLEDKMKNVGDFLYSTHWYNLNPKLQGLIPLVILNSQKTIRMDAVPIGHLNYELFVTLLKTTFSYFSVLTQLT